MLYIVHSYSMENSVRAAEWASQGFLTVASGEQRVGVLSLDFLRNLFFLVRLSLQKSPEGINILLGRTKTVEEQ